MSVTVFDLSTGKTLVFVGITPHQAVIAAHAQSLGDYNTWDYANKYKSEVGPSGRNVFCGNFGAPIFPAQRKGVA